MTIFSLSRRRLMTIAALAPLAGCSIGGGTGPRSFSLRPLPPAPSAGPTFALGIDPPPRLEGAR